MQPLPTAKYMYWNISSPAVSLSFFPFFLFLILSPIGGDVNITDSDGDTPLYTVENLQTARYLVEHGATVAHQNFEGLSASPSPDGYPKFLLNFSRFKNRS